MIQLPVWAFILVALALAATVGYYVRRATEARLQAEFRLAEKSIRKDSTRRSRTVIKGQLSERVATLLPEFPFEMSDARFLGNPIDYIVFDGYSKVQGRDQDTIDQVVFVEIKSGKAQLTREERRIRDCIQAGRVTWYEFRMEAGQGEPAGEPSSSSPGVA